MQRYKLIAIAIAIIALAVILIPSTIPDGTDERDGEIRLIAGNQNVGTGIYYNPEIIDKGNLFVLNDDGSFKIRETDEGDQVIFRPAGWDRLVIGIPTVGSVQYYQLKTIVETYLADPQYTDGTVAHLRLVASENPSSGQVGYLVTQGSAGSIREYQRSNGLAIGMTWDPQYSALVVGDDATFEGLVTNNLIFPHVTCCVLYANASFINDHREEAERTVWAIVNATNWLNDVVGDIVSNGYDPNDEAQKSLVRYAIKYAGGTSSGLTEEQVICSLSTIEYSWGDGSFDKGYNHDDPLSKIKKDTSSQTDNLYAMGGTVKKSLSELGFKDSMDFANSFVDDSVLKAALDTEHWDRSERSNIRIGVIANDIHHLPMHLADEILPQLSERLNAPELDDDRSLFDQVGLGASFLYASGSNQVITQMQSNSVDFGVAAEPAVIVYDINNGLTRK